MKLRLLFAVLYLLTAMASNTTASAQSRLAPTTAVAVPAPAKASSPVLSIAPGAADAVQVVNEFMSALSAGNLDAAQKFLDPAVVVVANSVVYGSRDDYLRGPAKGDAQYLKSAQRRLLRRQARAGAAFAWVISEKVLRVSEGSAISARLTTETMVLAKNNDGWKIVHINWSSRLLAIP